jgi:formylmethanofuran dehydrogenase subunit C
LCGDVGKFAGIHMKNGTIFVQGNTNGRTGAQMTNGKIVVCGQIPSILPTFTIDDIRSSTKVAQERIEGPFYRFIGDLAEEGKGKLFVSQARNPHLKTWAQYL